MTRALPLMLVVIATSACTTAYVPPPLGPEHPADPRAAEAPLPKPSSALAGRVSQLESPARHEHEQHHDMHGGSR